MNEKQTASQSKLATPNIFIFVVYYPSDLYVRLVEIVFYMLILSICRTKKECVALQVDYGYGQMYCNIALSPHSHYDIQVCIYLYLFPAAS